MRRVPRVGAAAGAAALAATLILGAAAGAHEAQAADASAVIYRLDKGSAYQQGCFDPCLCPLLEERPVRGTFALAPAGFDGLFDNYRVEDVNWTVSLGDPELRITGSGTYRLGGEFALMEQLVLDLRAGDNPVQRFDSGRVPTTGEFPAIGVTVSIHGQFCFDTVLRLAASPVPREQIHPYRLEPTSTFLDGCAGACDCFPGEPQPIGGTFALVDLRQDLLFRQFGVVDVDWGVAPPAGSSGASLPVRGFGTYRIGGEVALQHRLRLDLRVGGEDLAPFDSGLVAGGAAFPRLDIRISRANAECLDTVIDVRARPRRGLRRLRGLFP